MAPDSVDEMCRPIIMVDQESWGAAYGLGFGMTRRGDRVLVGHGGAMPGFLTGLQVKRSDKVGAVVSANGSAHAEPSTLAADLVTTVLDEQPSHAVALGARGPPTPTSQALLGPWWSEGERAAPRGARGRAVDDASPGPGAIGDTRFARESELTFRAVEGRERGELLEVVPDEDGSSRSSTSPPTPSPDDRWPSPTWSTDRQGHPGSVGVADQEHAGQEGKAPRLTWGFGIRVGRSWKVRITAYIAPPEGTLSAPNLSVTFFLIRRHMMTASTIAMASRP